MATIFYGEDNNPNPKAEFPIDQASISCTGNSETQTDVFEIPDLEKSIAEKYGIPPEDLSFEKTIPTNHRNVMNALLNEVRPVDFYERAGLDQGQQLTNKQLHVIINDEVQRIAKERKWGLCTHNQEVHVYNSEYWAGIPFEEIKVFLGTAALNMGVEPLLARHYSFTDALGKQFTASSYLEKPEKKREEITINLSNGTFVINPQERRLRGFQAEDFMTYKLPFCYDADADAKQFKNYLCEVLPEAQAQMVLAEFIAYVLIPNRVLALEKALVLYGDGANGKSVFFSIICALLGNENVSNYGLESLTNPSGYHRAKLGSYLLNYASEISPTMNSTIFKQLVSGEPVEARLPYKEPFVLRDYARFIFNTNQLPRDVEQNEAFFRRFLLVHFGITIPEERRDPDLAKKIISEELPGIFNWVLEGLDRLLENKNFTKSPSIDYALEDYKKKSDSVHLFLEDKGYIKSAEKDIFVQSIYLEYKEYCSEFGYKACSLKVFTERLRTIGFTIHRITRGNVVNITK